MGVDPECAAWPTKRTMCRSTPNVPTYDAGRPVHRLEDGPLLDVQLEIGAGVDRLQLARRGPHAIDFDAVLAQRIDEANTGPIDETAHVFELEAAARRRRAEEAPAEPRALFVGPVHELQRHRRPLAGVGAQRLEASHHAERAIEPAAVRDRVEMAADDDRAVGIAAQRRPAVAGGVE